MITVGDKMEHNVLCFAKNPLFLVPDTPGISQPKSQDILPTSLFSLRTYLGTLALKTENFSKKIGRFSKTRKWIY